MSDLDIGYHEKYWDLKAKVVTILVRLGYGYEAFDSGLNKLVDACNNGDVAREE